MEYYITFLSELTDKMWGSGVFHALFLVGLVVIALFEKNRLRKLRYVGLPIVVLLIIYNPGFLWLNEKVFGSDKIVLSAYYCRYFLMMPIVFVIAYAFVLLLQATSKVKKLIAVICLIVVIMQNGDYVYGQDWFVKASNVQKVPIDVLELSNLLGENHEEVKMLVPYSVGLYVRQVDAGINLVYGRYFSGQEEIVNQIGSENPDAEFVMEYARGASCDYIVCYNNPINCANFQNLGGRIVGITTNYVLIEI